MLRLLWLAMLLLTLTPCIWREYLSKLALVCITNKIIIALLKSRALGFVYIIMAITTTTYLLLILVHRLILCIFFFLLHYIYDCPLLSSTIELLGVSRCCQLGWTTVFRATLWDILTIDFLLWGGAIFDIIFLVLWYLFVIFIISHYANLTTLTATTRLTLLLFLLFISLFSYTAFLWLFLYFLVWCLRVLIANTNYRRRLYNSSGHRGCGSGSTASQGGKLVIILGLLATTWNGFLLL